MTCFCLCLQWNYLQCWLGCNFPTQAKLRKIGSKQWGKTLRCIQEATQKQYSCHFHFDLWYFHGKVTHSIVANHFCGCIKYFLWGKIIRSLGPSLLVHFSHISSTETNGVRVWRTGCRISSLFRSSPSCSPNSPCPIPQHSSSRNIFSDDLQLQIIYSKRKTWMV